MRSKRFTFIVLQYEQYNTIYLFFFNWRSSAPSFQLQNLPFPDIQKFMGGKKCIF